MKIKNHIGICADGSVGNKALEFLLENYFNDIKWILCENEQSLTITTVKEFDFDTNRVFLNRKLKEEVELNRLKKFQVDYIILAWWPHIIKKPFLSIPRIGVLNFHPSMLPYNKGKHYNFWSIVENSPFGVSIHFVNETIDGGDIIFQKEIEKDWLDTGETLYFKAQEAMIELFKEKYSDIRKGNYIRVEQNPNSGTFHYAKELDQASKIILDKNYSARELINLIRARTFVPHPAAWFEDNGKKYEIRLSITRK